VCRRLFLQQLSTANLLISIATGENGACTLLAVVYPPYETENSPNKTKRINDTKHVMIDNTVNNIVNVNLGSPLSLESILGFVFRKNRDRNKIMLIIKNDQVKKLLRRK
jgi:hypothetical protein